MYFDAAMVGLYGVVTVVLFLYGIAQRHLRKTVVRAIDLERAKAENSIIRAQEYAEASAKQSEMLAEQRLTDIQESIALFSRRAAEISQNHNRAQAALSALQGEIATAEARKKELLEVLQSKDAQALLKQAEEILEKVRSENLARKSEYLVSVVSFEEETTCSATYAVALQEMRAYWEKFPGATLKLLTRDRDTTEWGLEWQGTNPKSFAAFRACFDTYAWKNEGVAEIRVA